MFVWIHGLDDGGGVRGGGICSVSKGFDSEEGGGILGRGAFAAFCFATSK
jgi:hypothetical protein